jgi:hypothetical protein
MTDIRILQLACRGAMEAPNNPFAALEDVHLDNPRKMKAADRRRAALRDAHFSEFMMGLVAAKESDAADS